MPVKCPRCGVEAPADDVNARVDIARCVACQEVFRPSVAMGPAPGTRAPDTPRKYMEAPDGARARIDRFGDETVVRFPPRGFHWSLVPILVFAVSWWSFLLTFVGVSSGRGFREGPNRSAKESPASEPDAQDSALPSAEPGETREDSAFGLPWFVALFLTPFFLAGFAMIFAVVWPLFGRRTVRIGSAGCSHKACLFGLGLTRRAPPEATDVRWIETPAGRRSKGLESLVPQDDRIRLSLGAWRKRLGGEVSLAEQEWAFQEMVASLREARGR